MKSSFGLLSKKLFTFAGFEERQDSKVFLSSNNKRQEEAFSKLLDRRSPEVFEKG